MIFTSKCLHPHTENIPTSASVYLSNIHL
jgi:hypothetical protein